jgi:hypothetical protein
VTDSEWLTTNVPAVQRALESAQEELYALLGGVPDPEREQEVLAREVAKLRLKWRQGR